MTSHYTFCDPIDTPIGRQFRVGTMCATEAEAIYVVGWLKGRKVAEAFQPLPKPGEPFDAPEVPRYPAALDALAAQAQALGMYEAPPNCDGNRQFADASAVLAHAQHEAAEDGEGCSSVACLITKGVND